MHQEASKLAAHPKVAARIRELREPLEAQGLVLVSDQRLIDSGNASLLKKLPRLYARMNSNPHLTFAAGATALALLTSSPLAAITGGVLIASGATAWVGKRLIERSELKRAEVAYICSVTPLSAQFTASLIAQGKLISHLF